MRILAICVAAAACASPMRAAPLEAPPMQLAAGAPAAAPDGLLEYCRRAPGECQEAPVADLRGRIAATGAAGIQRASLEAGPAQGSLFHAMMAARLSQSYPASAAPRSFMVMTPARWRELRRINREINRAIQPDTDSVMHGVEEYWNRPLSAPSGDPRGDCEDYALEKRARLLGLGWTPGMLAMAVAVVPRIGLHATLLVQTSAGDFVLDNLSDEPRALAELDYLWISRQVGPSLTNWAIAASTAPALHADASPEAMFQRLMLERAAAREPAPSAPIAPVEFAPALLLPRLETAPLVPVADGVRALKPRDPAKPVAPPGGAYVRRGMVHIGA